MRIALMRIKTQTLAV